MDGQTNVAVDASPLLSSTGFTNPRVSMLIHTAPANDLQLEIKSDNYGILPADHAAWDEMHMGNEVFLRSNTSITNSIYNKYTRWKWTGVSNFMTVGTNIDIKWY